MSDSLKSLFKNYVFDGLLLTGLGVVLLIWPASALKAICIILGIVLILIGAFRLISYYLDQKEERKLNDLLIGIILVVLSITMFVFSNFYIKAFQYFIGLILIYGSALLFMRSYSQISNPGLIAKLSLVFGIIIAILALVIFINPVAFASFITKICGVSLIIEGVAMLISLHKFKLAVQEENNEIE